MWVRLELSLNGSGAPPLTVPASERLGFGRRPDSGTSDLRFRAAREEAAARRGERCWRGGCVRPQDMAHNKIPPRWLNCPRRGQPVAGERDPGARVPAHGRVRGWLRGRSFP